MNTNLHPHELRILAREQSYANSTSEQETVRAVDKAVFDSVRTFEEGVSAAAAEFMAAREIDLAAADELVIALRNEVKYPLMEGAGPSRDLAKRYEDLRREAEHALDELERAEREVEWHIDRNGNVYDAYVELMTKWPMIRPGLAI
jgi:hypothetical protein